MKLPLLLPIVGVLLTAVSLPAWAEESASFLDIELSPDLDVRLSWTNDNAVVEELNNLSPTNSWHPLGLASAFSSGRHSLTLPALETQRYYRLRLFSFGVLPVDPAIEAPPLSLAGAPDFRAATEFLYAGPNPVQIGVPPGAIARKRAAVLLGSVTQRDNEPLAGVTITILGHPEFGLTLTRADGLFDMAVNGGGALRVKYEKVGFYPVQRQVNVPWRDYVPVPEVVMIPFDPVVTPVTFGTNAPLQVARGSEQTDDDGVRQSTLLFPAGTCADLVMPDGTVIPCEDLSVRATEFTVGENGPASMPAELPPTSGYTYAVELSADEVAATGAATIQFNQPVFNYLENFLGFPVGTAVPSGFYDREQGAWIASKNGRVIGIVSINEHLAELDTDGDGVADNDASMGFTDAERQEIALLYQEGQSLWRVPVTHFTPWDYNFPFGPAGDVIDPNLNLHANSGVTGCELLGSVVEVQNQVLRKSVPVVGTAFSLNFSSRRVAGYKEARSLNIPLISSTVPDSLKQIILQVHVAGRVFTELFPAAPDQETTFTWDGQDAYGRTLQGKQPVTVRLGYLYEPVYTEPAELEASFAALGGTAITAARGGRFAIWQEWRGLIGLWNADAGGLGSWTLSEHHAQDTREAVIHLGTGVRYPVQSYEDVINTFATRLNRPTDVATGEDGSLYIADQGNHRIRRVDPDGKITTVAGIGNNGVFADGVPATEALIRSPSSVDVGPDGSLYISDLLHNRIRRVFPGADGAVTGQPDETITTIAGTGVSGTTGDGGPAVQAQIQEVNSIAVAPDGSVYFAQQNNNVRIRRISPGGMITTITTGRSISGIAIGPNGAIYYSESLSGTLRRVTSSGSSSVVADGLGSPWGVAVGPGSQLYVSTILFRDHRIYRIRGGPPVEFAGTGATGYSGDDGLALNAEMHTPTGLAVAPDGDVFIADSVNNVVRRVRRTLGGFATPLTPSPDGEEIFRFDGAGRHLQTLDSLTGAVLYRFEYDGHGLAAITDTFDNVTTIERDQEGAPLAIVSPFGQRTTLTVDANGYLETVTNPANETVRMQHSEDGLLKFFIDARDKTSQYRYDGMGLLVETEDPELAVNTYRRTEANIDGSHVRTVIRTTALDRSTTFRVEGRSDFDQKLTTSLPSGEKSERVARPSGSDVMTFADGSVASLVFAADPRFGMQAPVPANTTFDVSPGLRSTATVARTVDLRDPDDPLSLNGLTMTTTINGQQSVVAYDDANRTTTLTTPAGRQATSVLNAHGDVIAMEVPGLAPLAFDYDERGLLSVMTQGSGEDTRRASFTYDSRGFLQQVTDPLDRVTLIDSDDAGRITKITLPDLREIQSRYDGNGNLTALTPPGRPPHRYTYNSVNLPTAYAPPEIGMPGNDLTSTYNLDRQLTSVTTPDGETISLTYDEGGGCNCGRLTEVTHAEGSILHVYDPVTGQLTSVTAEDGGVLTYPYEGALVAGMVWAGTVSGRVDFTHNSNFEIAALDVNQTQAIDYAYDADGLVVQAGDLTVERDPQDGLVAATTVGQVTTSWAYNPFGEPTSHTASVAGVPVLETVFQRDKLGRITAKTETVQGDSITFEYLYDLTDRLVEARRNGVAESSFTYDSNDNRLTGPAAGTSYTYDDQDRLVQRGAISYTYTAIGDLLTKTENGETTSYSYDALGNLRNVGRPSGAPIEYLIDGEQRRIGKRVDGALVQGFLYEDGIRPIAELDGANNVVSRFVYASHVNVPDYMIKGGASYRIVTDHLGSPRLVIDVETGEVAQRIDYDPFGNVLADTNPGFQPFGFAGGLYDADTGLAHFGLRDYDPASGRWTGKDPISFAGDDSNLYAYTGNDPVNFTDPMGTAKNGDLIIRPKNLLGEPLRPYRRPGAGPRSPGSGPRPPRPQPFRTSPFHKGEMILIGKGELATIPPAGGGAAPELPNKSKPRIPRPIPNRALPGPRVTGFSGAFGGVLSAGLTVLTMSNCDTANGILSLVRQGKGGLANKNADRLFRQIDRY